MPGRFCDTNVILYVASSDTANAERAESLIGAGASISVQVCNEAANVARKTRMTWPDIHLLLSSCRTRLSVQPITLETHETGLAFAERYHFSIYDAMIATAACAAGCNILWLEERQHGMKRGEGLRIRNPFGAMILGAVARM